MLWPRLTVLTVLALAETSHAMCGGFVRPKVTRTETEVYADAAHVILIRRGTRTVVVMRNDYRGPPQEFAMVVPVPVALRAGDVQTFDSRRFVELANLGAPTVTSSCRNPPRRDVGESKLSVESARSSGPKEASVQVLESFSAGEYDLEVLSAADALGLEEWLKGHGYAVPNNIAASLRPYVAVGTKFFVARVDPARLQFKDGKALLSPLQFAYDSEQLQLPIRLGLANLDQKQDLVISIFGTELYETANTPNALSPTGLAVRARTMGEFRQFYDALIDTLSTRTPGVMLTEHAGAWTELSSWDRVRGTVASLLTELARGRGVALPEFSVKNDDPEVRQAVRDYQAQKDPPDRQPTWVLTRLHARYDRKSAPDDLVFRVKRAGTAHETRFQATCEQPDSGLEWLRAKTRGGLDRWLVEPLPALTVVKP